MLAFYSTGTPESPVLSAISAVVQRALPHSTTKHVQPQQSGNAFSNIDTFAT